MGHLQSRDKKEKEEKDDNVLNVIFYQSKYDDEKIEEMRRNDMIDKIDWDTETYKLNCSPNTLLKEIYERLEAINGFSKEEKRLYSFFDDLSFHEDDEFLYSVLFLNRDGKKQLYIYKIDELYEITVKPDLGSEFKIKIHDSMKIENIKNIAVSRLNLGDEMVRYSLHIKDIVLNKEKTAIFYNLKE